MSEIDIIVLDDPEGDSRYTRQSQIAGWNQERLQEAAVFVAGAGALGNEILKNLALLGVGLIVVVDMDHIEISNLSRSVLFREGDTGQPKAAVAASRIQDLNPDAKVIPIVGNLTQRLGLGLLRRMDLVLGGLDNIEARMWINRACQRLQAPWVDAALDAFNGVMRVYHHDGACFECNMTSREYKQMALRYSCQNIVVLEEDDGGIPTTTMSASLTAALQVQEGVSWLNGKPPQESFAVEYLSGVMRLDHRTLSRRDTCFAHDPLDLSAIVELASATNTMTVGELRQLAATHITEGDPLVQLWHEVVYRQVCGTCGATDETVLAKHDLSMEANACPNGHGEREVTSTHALSEATAFLDGIPLVALGIAPLEILRFRNKQGTMSVYVELTGDLPKYYPLLAEHTAKGA